MSRTLGRSIVLVCAVVLSLTAPLLAQPQPGGPPAGQGRQGQPRPPGGPWENDIIAYRIGSEGPATRLATFPRAGVATAARLADGRLIVAHQHFPENNQADFDKVAVRFSSDEGTTWTEPRVIRLSGLPEGMRFPFDPTLVPLPDGRVRLYFTSLRGRRFEESTPAIYSAISSDGESYTFEPGVRFAIEGKLVIDCAVVLHKGIFHMFVPDNGPSGAPPRGPGPAGRGYHATSQDGLSFQRQPDLQIPGERHWLGNAQSDGDVIRFFGTGGPGGLWIATSPDGLVWTDQPAPPRMMAADPGAVKLKDGGWLIVGTGRREDRGRRAGPQMDADERR